MHSFGDWLTGSDCMNDDELMTDDSDESVSRYKNKLIAKKCCTLFSTKKYSYILYQHYAQCFSIPIMVAQNYPSMMCLSLLVSTASSESRVQRNGADSRSHPIIAFQCNDWTYSI